MRTRMTFSPRFAQRLGVRGVEDDAAGRGAGTGVQTLGQEASALDRGLLLGFRSKIGRRSWFSWSGSTRARASFSVISLSLDHVDGDLDGGEGGALADAALEHVQLALLDGELDVLHVVVVLLERLADLVELAVDLRDSRRLSFGDRQRRADAGDDVLALGVHQVLAVEDVLAGGRRRA